MKNQEVDAQHPPLLLLNLRSCLNDLLDFIIVRKDAGENTGNGGLPRLVFSPTAK
jgi:hypothetical protein